MASQNKIVLFDLTSKPPRQAWSLNPWKTRFLLNFKGLDYETQWVEYPEIRTRLEPHLPGLDAYTIPTVLLPDGTYVMDSRKIVEVIEKMHPEPSIHLDTPYLPKLENLMRKLMPALRGNYFPIVPDRLLNPVSAEYWYETRPKRVGKPLDVLEKEEGGEIGWRNAEPFLKEITAMLEEKPEGPFFEGKTVSYPDFVWAGCLIFWRRIGEDKFNELLKRTGNAKVHEDLLKACEPWSKRNDH